MATADQVKALLRSHADGDESRFVAVALQVAAQAARSGHGKLALELRALVDEVRERTSRVAPSTPGAKIVPITQPRGELASILAVSYPKTRLGDMALATDLRERLSRVVSEQRQRERLRAHGFSPQRKLLFAGPPGTGKTMTARALASELGLPLFSVQLDGLITKFLGETAAKLRLVFDAIEATRAVYLFDEFDALGGERSAGNDAGEIRRVLNSFLQFLEQDASDSVVIGATNHVGLLDRALFRRFDAVVDYSLPNSTVAVEVMQGRLALFDTDAVEWEAITANAVGLSHAELVMACEQSAKDLLLAAGEAHAPFAVTTEGLLSAIRDRHSIAHRSR
jgi:SpoVK/Ycf46/Vps4 family AAA+-type ATPase